MKLEKDSYDFVLNNKCGVDISDPLATREEKNRYDKQIIGSRYIALMSAIFEIKDDNFTGEG